MEFDFGGAHVLVLLLEASTTNLAATGATHRRRRLNYTSAATASVALTWVCCFVLNFVLVSPTPLHKTAHFVPRSFPCAFHVRTAHIQHNQHKSAHSAVQHEKSWPNTE